MDHIRVIRARCAPIVFESDSMKNRLRIGFTFLLLFALYWQTQKCLAQSNGVNSDAIVIIQPSGKSATLFITFPGVVSHESVKQRIARLGQIAGWPVSSVDVKDEEISTRAAGIPTVGLGKQTGATVLLSNVTLMKDGGFLLQPLVQAFSDLRRIEVLYFVQQQRNFNGLKDFDSKVLAVKLVKDGGPYRYAIDIKEQGVPLPNLPLTQPVVASGASPADVSGVKTAATNTADFAFVLLVAAGCSLVVLAALLILGRYRSAQINGSNSRRAHRL
jgi:hypothetical protein